MSSSSRGFRIAVVAVGVLAVMALKGWQDNRVLKRGELAVQLGFDGIADMEKAEAAGIKDPVAWRGKVAADAAEARRKAEEQAVRAAKLAEEVKIAAAAKRRNAQLEALTIFVKAPMNTDVNLTTLAEHGALLSIWRDFDVILGEFSPQSKDEARVLDQASAKLTTMKAKVYPRLRKSFEKVAGQELWVNDAKVQVSGPRNENVLFVQHGFVLNRNIQESMNAAQDMLERLGFKKACFASSTSEYAERWCYQLGSKS